MWAFFSYRFKYQAMLSKILTFSYKLMAFVFLFLVAACEVQDQVLPDERFLWTGTYSVTETVYDPFSGAPSTVYYDLTIDPIFGESTGVEVYGLNGATINGIPCILDGDVWVAEELNIIRNICDLGVDDYLEISGYGEVDPDGCCAFLEFRIDHCINGQCVSEPIVYLDLQKY